MSTESPSTARPVYASPADRTTHGRYCADGALTPLGWQRPQPVITGRVSADGSTGLRAEPGRYHLYIAWSCGWAQRAAIVRRLTGLEDVVSLSHVDDERDGRGWAFRQRRGPDPVNGFALLREAYEATVPGYSGHVSTPVLWDRRTARIASNDYGTIPIDLATAFGAWARPAVQLRPAALLRELDAMNDFLYENVNDGVYRADGATTQAAYDFWRGRVCAALDALDARLGSSRFLFGNRITESDVRLWTTLARFDLAYNPACGISTTPLAGFPNLWGYARDLYQRPAFRDTTDFTTFRFGKPSPRADGIVRQDVDPVESDWDTPHGRERFSR